MYFNRKNLVFHIFNFKNMYFSENFVSHDRLSLSFFKGLHFKSYNLEVYQGNVTQKFTYSLLSFCITAVEVNLFMLEYWLND
jgi:hypothetical protein